jgi:hypothetical protein
VGSQDVKVRRYESSAFEVIGSFVSLTVIYSMVLPFGTDKQFYENHGLVFHTCTSFSNEGNSSSAMYGGAKIPSGPVSKFKQFLFKFVVLKYRWICWSRVRLFYF